MSIPVMTKSYSKLWNILLLVLRLWLGYIMMENGRFFFKLFISEAYRKYFDHWFGAGLHFPFPLFLAFVAKGAEFFGGLLVLFGLFTRIGASLIFITMLVATLSANIWRKSTWDVDGTITVSLCLLATVCICWGGGKFAIDSLLKKPIFDS